MREASGSAALVPLQRHRHLVQALHHEGQVLRQLVHGPRDRHHFWNYNAFQVFCLKFEYETLIKISHLLYGQLDKKRQKMVSPLRLISVLSVLYFVHQRHTSIDIVWWMSILYRASSSWRICERGMCRVPGCACASPRQYTCSRLVTSSSGSSPRSSMRSALLSRTIASAALHLRIQPQLVLVFTHARSKRQTINAEL